PRARGNRDRAQLRAQVTGGGDDVIDHRHPAGWTGGRPVVEGGLHPVGGAGDEVADADTGRREGAHLVDLAADDGHLGQHRQPGAVVGEVVGPLQVVAGAGGEGAHTARVVDGAEVEGRQRRLAVVDVGADAQQVDDGEDDDEQ